MKRNNQNNKRVFSFWVIAVQIYMCLSCLSPFGDMLRWTVWVRLVVCVLMTVTAAWQDRKKGEFDGFTIIGIIISGLICCVMLYHLFTHTRTRSDWQNYSAGFFPPSEAEDDGGQTPTWDDNEAWREKDKQETANTGAREYTTHLSAQLHLPCALFSRTPRSAGNFRVGGGYYC
jgi:hypothetical protein